MPAANSDHFTSVAPSIRRVSGPLMPMMYSRNVSTVSSGSESPVSSNAYSPASTSIQSMVRPCLAAAASSTSVAAGQMSTPVPSPSMKGMMALADTFSVPSEFVVSLSPIGLPPEACTSGVGARAGGRLVLACLVLVRDVRPGDYERAGAVVLASYLALPGHVEVPGYERELADVATRAMVAEVVVAVEGEGDGERDGEGDTTVIGCVTYVPDFTNPYAEFEDPDAAGFRMLGVDPARQGSGAGRALVEWCIERAVADGKARLLIHSTPWMTRAHALYERLGFERRPDFDWVPVPRIELLGFGLELDSRNRGGASSAG